MIFSLLLRNFKTYRGINYVPLSNGDSFTSMVGDNGVGKSSVLEALNSFFNDAEWNFNHSLARGFADREPYICPVFLINKRFINPSRNVYKYLDIVSDVMWQLEREDFNSSQIHLATEFCKHRESISERVNKDDYFLFCVGVEKTSKVSQKCISSIFSIEEFDDRLNEEGYSISSNELLSEMYDFVLDYYDYIYLPADIDYENYTKIEGDTVQALMGAKIEEIVKDLIDDKHIKEINQRLNIFMEGIAETLENYEYKKPAKKQNLFNQTHLSNKVIETYFNSKVLNLVTENGEHTPVYNLSSGEKRRALLDIAQAFLLNSERKKNRQLILALDEPEISLNVLSCFPQFEKLKKIASNDIQTIITTHWYGFMPIVSNGACVYISGERNGNHIINLDRFRDDILKLKESTRGNLPSNIELKGINDLVQSVIASVMGGDYCWVICEGVSDKIYLDEFLKERKNTIVLPVSGAPSVKKFFNYMYMALKDDRPSVTGKVFFMLDTDKKADSFVANDGVEGLRMRRLLNDYDANRTKLVKMKEDTFHPPTAIEDVLNVQPFLEAVKKTANEFLEFGGKDFTELVDSFEVRNYEAPSGLALDLKDSQKRDLEEFFLFPGVKISLAKNYVLQDDIVPKWFGEVEDYFYAP